MEVIDIETNTDIQKEKIFYVSIIREKYLLTIKIINSKIPDTLYIYQHMHYPETKKIHLELKPSYSEKKQVKDKQEAKDIAYFFSWLLIKDTLEKLQEILTKKDKVNKTFVIMGEEYKIKYLA